MSYDFSFCIIPFTILRHTLDQMWIISHAIFYLKKEPDHDGSGSLLCRLAAGHDAFGWLFRHLLGN